MERVLDHHLKYSNHCRLPVKLDRVEIFPEDNETGEFQLITDQSPVIKSRDQLISFRHVVDNTVTNFFFQYGEWACTTVMSPEAREAICSADSSAIEKVKEHYWVYISFDKWNEVSDVKGEKSSDLASFKANLDKLAKSQTLEDDLALEDEDEWRELEPDEADGAERDAEDTTVSIKSIVSISPDVISIARSDLVDEIGANALASEFVSINCNAKKRKLLDLLAEESGLDHYEFDRQSKRAKKE